ncbi:MAG: hypothetical protein ABJN34_07250 [Litoreibacter sp.]|uniref:hypothetical protein n=1 Tax=Litoreibacter sp. TaxID=1969459 RepID=UPI00329A0D99
MQNLIVLLLAMTASGAIGFYLARERYMVSDGAKRRMANSASRLRRRVRDAEDASKRLKVKRGQVQRPQRTK